MSAVMTITDPVGESREVIRTYPDGSWDCPFCSNAVIAPKTVCEYPACYASVFAYANPSWIPEAKAKEVSRRAEEAHRIRNHALAMERIAEDCAERQRRYDDLMRRVRERGYCARCARKAGIYFEKLVRHRKTCPYDK